MYVYNVHVHVYNIILHKTMYTYIPVSNLVTPKRDRKRVMTKKKTRERMMKMSSHEGREHVAA